MKTFSKTISLKVDEETFDFLKSLKKQSIFTRNAIHEKMQREGMIPKIKKLKQSFNENQQLFINTKPPH